MATIEWRAGKRGKYAYLNWSDDRGQHRESLGAVTPAAAKVALHAKELELLTGQRVLSTAPTIEELAIIYLEWHKSEYPDSHERVEQIVNQHIVPHFRYVAADQVPPLMAERWKAGRMNEVAASTVGKEVRTFKAMLNWGVEIKTLPVNPLDGIAPPQDLNSAPPHWYEMEQLHRLYATTEKLSKVRRATWQLMANTGIRCAEARHLKPEHVSSGGIKLLSETGARTKSRKWREVPMSDNATAAFEVLMADNRTDYVLPIVTGPSLSRIFAKDRDRAKLDGSAHSLRHTFGTHQAMKGTPIRVLQQLMGHASIKTTEKYLHVAEHHLRSAISGFNL